MERERWRSATEVERENWRKKIIRTPQPTSGCFTATFPETEWRTSTCITPPRNAYFPKHLGIRTEQVGGGGNTDFTVEVTGNISEAIGVFPSVTGVVSEANSNGAPNAYSLQLNTQPFETNTCAGSQPVVGAVCQGWQQFVYNPASGPSTGSGYIQYWLLIYGRRAQAARPQEAQIAHKAGFGKMDGVHNPCRTIQMFIARSTPR